MTSPVRVRFAPSPTGYLHIGGARTALFNWLHAKHTGGTFVLRVEDTDRARNTEVAAQAIYDGLRWLGLEWDEGPHAGGEFGPYFQSEREEIYLAYLEHLRAAGRVYDDEGSVRFRFAREKVVVDDVICGQVEIDMANPETNPDMTIRRPDGSWIFHFVNVVDDIEMKISHVIRGEDHLSNTPKHIQLYRAFGTEPPRFAHIPLILNLNGSKMSKRDEGASVNTYIEGGYLPEGVRNYLCLLGWSPKDDREKIDIHDVITLFDLQKINRKSAIFDLEKCTWFSGEYMRSLPIEQFLSRSKRYLQEHFPSFERVIASRGGETYVDRVLLTCVGKIKVFAELLRYAFFYFSGNIKYDPLAVQKYLTLENEYKLTSMLTALRKLQFFDISEIERVIKQTAKELGLKVNALVQPVRVATTGETFGPSLYDSLAHLGQPATIARLGRAIGWIRSSYPTVVVIGPDNDMVEMRRSDFSFKGDDIIDIEDDD